jgi:hypothetical protein
MGLALTLGSRKVIPSVALIMTNRRPALYAPAKSTESCQLEISKPWTVSLREASSLGAGSADAREMRVKRVVVIDFILNADNHRGFAKDKGSFQPFSKHN